MRKGMDDKRWRLANSMILYCLPGKAWACRFHPRDCVPGYHRSALWRLPDALSPQQSYSNDERWLLANRRRSRRRYRPQPTVTGRDVARNVSTAIAPHKQKKGPTSMRLDPESGGYLLSRNSVPSAIASLTSLFGMGRGGTSLP